MSFREKITDYSLQHYGQVALIMVVFTVGLGAFTPLIKVDTDPENMLSEDEPVRVFHNKTKERFTLSDIVVVGAVNDKHTNGVFNPDSLARIYELTEFAKTLRWPDKNDPNKQVGVIEIDLLAPSTVDHIGQGGPGVVKFEWLMKKPPATAAEAKEVRERALSNPLLAGTLVSEDGKALCLYLPLTSKDLSHKVYVELNRKIAAFKSDDQFHITGLPVAEDTFGYEMFVQMAISAPLAMVVIFILMLIFFRKLVLIISPMIVAIVSVISTMGLLIGFGFPVHIMSSMIPIFLMPISVVDSVHIISEFFDRYTQSKGRNQTVRETMSALFTPMLYTSLTSAAGFVSLALTPIPPVQVFGVFVAIGIMIAWLATVTFVPAYVMMIPEKSLENFGYEAQRGKKQTWLTRLLRAAGRFTYKQAKPILTAMLLIAVVAVYGITRIEINDNPVKWFSKRHPIRKADIELNRHFDGTYMAYLVVEPNEDTGELYEYIAEVRDRLQNKGSKLANDFPNAQAVIDKAEKVLLASASKDQSKEQLLDAVIQALDEKYRAADDKTVDIWFEILNFFELEKEALKAFKQPEVLRYISKLEAVSKQP
jgi:predicted RND superfamily exporter protein